MTAIVWYYVDGSGRTLGPVLTPTMRGLLKDGTIKPNTLIRCNECEEWIRSIDSEVFQRTMSGQSESSRESQDGNTVEKFDLLAQTTRESQAAKSAATVAPEKTRTKDQDTIQSRIGSWLQRHWDESSQSEPLETTATEELSKVRKQSESPRAHKESSSPKKNALGRAANTPRASAADLVVVNRAKSVASSDPDRKTCPFCHRLNFSDGPICWSCSGPSDNEVSNPPENTNGSDGIQESLRGSQCGPVRPWTILRFLVELPHLAYSQRKTLKIWAPWFLLWAIPSILVILCVQPKVSAWMSAIANSLSFTTVFLWTGLIPLTLFFVWLRITEGNDNTLNGIILLSVIAIFSIQGGLNPFRRYGSDVSNESFVGDREVTERILRSQKLAEERTVTEAEFRRELFDVLSGQQYSTAMLRYQEFCKNRSFRVSSVRQQTRHTYHVWHGGAEYNSDEFIGEVVIDGVEYQFWAEILDGPGRPMEIWKFRMDIPIHDL